MPDNVYDAIIIGSGIGGLTAGSLLAQLGNRRVLVLERHFKLGGFTHAFRRGPYEWDVGLHYVGQMQRGSFVRRIMDLITDSGVDWQEMNSPVERLIFDQTTFDVPADQRAFSQALIARFPEEQPAIDRYFRDIEAAENWMTRWFFSKQLPAALGRALNRFGRRLPTMSTAAYLARFRSETLQAILAGQWPDHGTTPDQSAFGFHAQIAAHYMQGGFYPIGGGEQIVRHAVRPIALRGGQCLVNHNVSRINVTAGAATSVVAQNKGRQIEFHAPIIVSDAGAVTTFQQLLGPDHCQPEREQTSRLRRGVSARILFLGLREDPRAHGFDDRNYWMYSRLTPDLEAPYRDGDPDRLEGCFVSFGSLRNPMQTAHTAQIISFSRQDDWSDFHGTSWRRRGADYERRKQHIAALMVDYAEQRLPGLRKLIAYQELATPLTVESFTGHPGGAIYGQACDANRLERDQWRVGTSLPGLFLTGSDVGMPGITAAMMAGVMTAAKIMGPAGFLRILWHAYRSAPRPVLEAGLSGLAPTSEVP